MMDSGLVSCPASQLIDRTRLIHEVFRDRAQLSPDAIALTYKEQWLTYQGLNDKTDQLARYLSKRGVGAESRVAICVERSLDMVVGLLGILKAGGGYVPLDPSYPVERLHYILEDCGSVLLLTQEHLRKALGPLQVPHVVLDADWDTIAGAYADQVCETTIALNPGNLAYVIYTSGSTGTPKGVMVEHRNVMSFLVAVNKCFHFGPHCIWAVFHSFAFDVSVMELWGGLLTGGRVVIISYAISRFPRDLYALLSTEGVTVLCQTPSAFRRLVSAETEEDRPLFLDDILLAGEALQLTSLQPWYKHESNRARRLANLYGPTETTVYVTCQKVRISDKDLPGGSVIGVSLENSQIAILDESREPVRGGDVGEIHIGGAGVARGYLNRPALTAERFIAASVGAEGARLYRSGDLGRRCPDGKIEYRGRNDSQVKVRGFRIELGEIEFHLAAVEGVREVVVTTVGDVASEIRIVAYLTAKEGVKLTTSEVRGELLRRLPIHMIPTEFVLLTQMPLNGSGKIDRRGLILTYRHHDFARQSDLR